MRSCSPLDLLEIPLALIADVRLEGGWWAPRVVLRAQRLDAFDEMPSARPGAVTLGLRRRDRAHAAMIVSAIAHSRAQMAAGSTAAG